MSEITFYTYIDLEHFDSLEAHDEDVVCTEFKRSSVNDVLLSVGTAKLVQQSLEPNIFKSKLTDRVSVGDVICISNTKSWYEVLTIEYKNQSK